MKQRINHILKSQAGVTLVELMVYVAMLGGISILIATLGVNMNRSAVVREADLLAAEFMQDFQTNLSRKGICDYNFEGENSTKAAAAFKYPNEIRNSDGSSLYSIGQKLDNYFTLSDMSMAKINDTRADISLDFTRTGTKSNAVTLLKRKLKLTIAHEADGTTIRSCLVSFDQITGDQLPLICNGEGTILSDSGTPTETSDDICIHAGYSMERCPDGEYVQRFELVNIDDGSGKLQPFYRPVCISANIPKSLLCPFGEVLQGYSAVDGLICRPLAISDIRPHMMGDFTSCGHTQNFPIKMVGSNINIHCGPAIGSPTPTSSPVATMTPATPTATPTSGGANCITVSDEQFVVQLPLTTPLNPAVNNGRVRVIVSGKKKDGTKASITYWWGSTGVAPLRMSIDVPDPKAAAWASLELHMQVPNLPMNYLYVMRVNSGNGGVGLPFNSISYGLFHIGMSQTYPATPAIPNMSVICLVGEPQDNCGYIKSVPYTGLEGVKPLTLCVDDSLVNTPPMWDVADPFNEWALP